MTITLGPDESILITTWLIIFIILALFGWLYADRITDKPFKKTYWEVVIGSAATLAGQFALGWFVANYYGISFWVFFCAAILPSIPAWGITGGFMIWYQDWKHKQDEAEREARSIRRQKD